jgi:hypothetical protein
VEAANEAREDEEGGEWVKRHGGGGTEIFPRSRAWRVRETWARCCCSSLLVGPVCSRKLGLICQ